MLKRASVKQGCCEGWGETCRSLNTRPGHGKCAVWQRWLILFDCYRGREAVAKIIAVKHRVPVVKIWKCSWTIRFLTTERPTEIGCTWIAGSFNTLAWRPFPILNQVPESRSHLRLCLLPPVLLFSSAAVLFLPPCPVEPWEPQAAGRLIHCQADTERGDVERLETEGPLDAWLMLGDARWAWSEMEWVLLITVFYCEFTWFRIIFSPLSSCPYLFIAFLFFKPIVEPSPALERGMRMKLEPCWWLSSRRI